MAAVAAGPEEKKEDEDEEEEEEEAAALLLLHLPACLRRSRAIACCGVMGETGVRNE